MGLLVEQHDDGLVVLWLDSCDKDSIPVNLSFRWLFTPERLAAPSDVWPGYMLLFARNEAKWVKALLKSIAFILSEPWLGRNKAFKQRIGALRRFFSLPFTNVLMRDAHLGRTVIAAQVVRIKYVSIYSFMHKCKCCLGISTFS